ncbi:MAG: hypothetical protein JSU01_03835 [Bacteroidetes bacterium]|nr:hypothetical protein [Bacteroidota bacterium]
MTYPQSIVEIPGMIQARTCKSVIFAGDGLTIEQPFKVNSKIFVPNGDIAAFRFGIKELRLFKFVLGREYYIEIKDFKCAISRIKLYSLYGARRKEYYKIWADLLQNLWDFYFDSQLSYYTELYNIQQCFELAGVTFLTDGISWNKMDRISWDKIGIKSYQNYFLIHHADDPRQYKCCIFSIDWNGVILQSLLKDIIREHQKVHRTIRRDRQ